MRTLTTTRKYRRVLLLIAVIVILFFAAPSFLRSSGDSASPSKSELSPHTVNPNRKPPSLRPGRPHQKTKSPLQHAANTDDDSDNPTPQPTTRTAIPRPTLALTDESEEAVEETQSPRTGESTPSLGGEPQSNQGDVRSRLKQNRRYNENTTVLHVVSHHHWDREWYQPFEKFRRSLVLNLDVILDLFEKDPNFTHFHLDGQSIIAEDYLEIRPDKRKILQALVKQNKLSLGPWYTQPDTYLISGEALVRNLLIGLSTAATFGPPLRLGYLADSFGHVSQLPQVFLGFDIKAAMMSRGSKPSVSKGSSELYWRGPDGSKIFVSWLASWYCNALFHHRVSPQHSDADIIKWFGVKLQKVWRDHSRVKHALLLNGCDHSGVDYDVSEVIGKANALLEEQNVIVIHSNMRDYVDIVTEEIAKSNFREEFLQAEIEAARRQRELDGLFLDERDNTKETMAGNDRFLSRGESGEGKKETDKTQKIVPHFELPELDGELHSGEDVQIQLANIYSAMITQKQNNWRLQSGLALYAEPLATVLWFDNSNEKNLVVPTFRYDHQMFDHAWKLLLQNHAHDSIGGCSVSGVHRDVDNRFDRGKQIADSLFAEAFTQILNTISIAKFHSDLDKNRPKDGEHVRNLKENPIYFVVYNPLPTRRKEIVVVDLYLSTNQRVDSIVVFDSSSKVVPSTILNLDYDLWDHFLPDKGFRKGFHIPSSLKISLEVEMNGIGYELFGVSVVTSFSGISQRVSNDENGSVKKNVSYEESIESDQNAGKFTRSATSEIPKEEVNVKNPGSQVSDPTIGDRNSDSDEPIVTEASIHQDESDATDAGTANERKIENENDADVKLENSNRHKHDQATEQSERRKRGLSGSSATKSRGPHNSTNVTISSKFLELTLSTSTGYLTATDLKSGLIINDLHVLQFCVDSGATYQSEGNDCILGRKPKVLNVIRNSVFSSIEFELEIDFSVFYSMRPQNKNVQKVFVGVLLGTSSRRIEFRTSLFNRNKNFLIRASFPAFAAQYSSDETMRIIDSTFDYVSQNLYQQDMTSDNDYVHAQQSFFSLFNRELNVGLAVGNRGLPEIYHYHSITLMRAVDRMGDWGRFPTPGTTQLQGYLAFEYCVIPFQLQPKNLNTPHSILPKQDTVESSEIESTTLESTEKGTAEAIVAESKTPNEGELISLGDETESETFANENPETVPNVAKPKSIEPGARTEKNRERRSVDRLKSLKEVVRSANGAETESPIADDESSEGALRADENAIPSAVLQHARIVHNFNTPLIARQVLTKGARGPLSHSLIGLDRTELSRVFLSAAEAEEFEEKKGTEGFRDLQLDEIFPIYADKHRNLPYTHNYLQVIPANFAFFSSLKKSEKTNHIILRVFNPTTADANVTVLLNFMNKPIREAVRCNLNEEEIAGEKIVVRSESDSGDASTMNRNLQFLLPRKKIYTFKIN